MILVCVKGRGVGLVHLRFVSWEMLLYSQDTFFFWFKASCKHTLTLTPKICNRPSGKLARLDFARKLGLCVDELTSILMDAGVIGR